MVAAFFQWLGVVIALGALVIWGFTTLRPVRELLLPMWLPLAVMAIAGIALFGTEQGRDLGVGLFGDGQLQLVMLGLALFYWAVGSWHAARLGLNRRFGTKRASWPQGYEPWLRWLPRLLGACAHLFAALILALAARHVIAADAEPILFVPLWLVGFVPPAVIIVAVFVLWRHDQRYVAARNAFERQQASGNADPASRTAYAAAKRHLQRTVWLIIGVSLAISGGLYLLGDRLPDGLAAATGWVLISAASFLLVVSYRKAIGQWVLRRGSVSEGFRQRLRRTFEETDERHALSSTVLACALSAVALAVAAWAWSDPISLGPMPAQWFWASSRSAPTSRSSTCSACSPAPARSSPRSARSCCCSRSAPRRPGTFTGSGCAARAWRRAPARRPSRPGTTAPGSTTGRPSPRRPRPGMPRQGRARTKTRRCRC
jgi:hypothetical protein